MIIGTCVASMTIQAMFLTNHSREDRFTAGSACIPLLQVFVSLSLASSDGPSGRVLLEHDAAPSAPEQPAAGERATGAVLGAPPGRPAPAARVPVLPDTLCPGALRGPAQADCGPRTFFLDADLAPDSLRHALNSRSASASARLDASKPVRRRH